MTAAVFALLIIVGGFAYVSEQPTDDHSQINICVGHCANTMPVKKEEEPCEDE